MDILITFDFVVLGAGMAGASAAAQLATRGRVAVLEREEHAGYHSTGRSAALFSEIYGGQVVRALSRASRPFLFDPPAGFATAPLVHPRPTLFFARPDQMDSLARFRTDSDVAAATIELSAAGTLQQAPVFRDGYLGGGLLESGSADIDVDALHQGFLRQARARGAQVSFNVDVRALRRDGGLWHVETAAGIVSAPVVVNAAGAWGDEVARLAGVEPVGLQPKRRTAMLIEAPVARPGSAPMSAWAAAIDIDEQFYFKPDAGLLLLSPADEAPSPPCDVQPEELDIAIAVERFEQATGTQVRRVVRRWAGLRVFTADRTPVVGFDPDAAGFFWLVGQGGYGIQTAEALGRVAAALAAGEALPSDVAAIGVTPALLSPARLAVSTSLRA